MDKAKLTLTFTITTPAGTRDESVTQDVVKIGRDPKKSHLRLDDDSVSNLHAVVEARGKDEVELFDSGNESGTLVNGQRVNRQKLKVGDEIKVGSCTLVLKNIAIAGAQEAANPFASAAEAPNPFASGAAAPAANNPFASGAAAAANPFGTGSPFSSAFGAAAAPSPFEASAHSKRGKHGHGHDHEDGVDVTYRLVKSGPDVPEAEAERANVQAVEVMVMWGTTILQVTHLSPPRNFYIGEGSAKGNMKGSHVDFRMPAEKLGCERMPLVVIQGGAVYAIIPKDSKGTIENTGNKSTLEEARNGGVLKPSNEAPGAEMTLLSQGGKSRVELNGFTFQVSVVKAGRKPKGALSKGNRAGLIFWLASAAMHVGIVTALMMSPGESLDEENPTLDKSTQAFIMQMQKNQAEKEIAEQEEEKNTAKDKNEQSGGTGTAHKGTSGMMGDPSKAAANAHYSIKGPPDTQEVKIARTRALIESGNYGAIGALNSVFGSTANAPIAFDSDSDHSIGRDNANHNGNMMGDHAGDSFGYGGLGLTGTGAGGGGWGDGIGLGNVGGFGHGGGTGSGQGIGGGSGGRLTGRKPRKVQMIEQTPSINGRISPEVIRRIIRANFPRFRACYDQGLKRDPGLKGTVRVKFIIDNTGAVESASSAGGSMPDAGVSGCVLGVYRTLSFPEPEGGKVLVTYPIDFQNDEG